MTNIVKYPGDIQKLKNEYIFMNKPVRVLTENGEGRTYPCISLFEKATDFLVYPTGYERYLCPLFKGELLKGTTLDSRAYAVCHFLNFILWKTDVEAIHECTLNTIRDFLVYLKSEKQANNNSWTRYRDYVVDFLVLYYEANKDVLSFSYAGEDLQSVSIAWDEKRKRRGVAVKKASLHVNPPRTTHKKNRALPEGYLEFLLSEAKKYAPDLALGIALGAYAGLREGEVVNLTCSSIKLKYKGFGRLDAIEIDLMDGAPFFKRWRGKTNPGSIKKNRIQRVYPDFIKDISEMYEEHLLDMETKGIDTGTDSPLFVNKRGDPMTVKSYTVRIKELFYDSFLPHLKENCIVSGTYGDNAAFIETYENEYPGAHAFRHWFTMYLLTKARLTSGEIMKWRGDSSQESMNEYIHENADMIALYRENSYRFQEQILEDIGIGGDYYEY